MRLQSEALFGKSLNEFNSIRDLRVTKNKGNNKG